jgi:transposase-like protein
MWLEAQDLRGLELIGRRRMLQKALRKAGPARPRDRQSTFDPKLIARYQRQFPGFDEKIVSMYARGMTVREIQAHLMEIYGLDVSPDLISTVTDAVLARWRVRAHTRTYAHPRTMLS